MNTVRTVLLAGASGLLGRALATRLQAEGWEVRRLVRRPATAPGEFTWDPARGEVPAAALAGATAVINLAGENIAAGRWTAARRRALRSSRIDPTRTLALALATMSRPPEVFACASAVGFYGHRGDVAVAEDAARGEGFLAELTAEWEAAGAGVESAGVRWVALRLGVILSPEGGALARLLPVFRLGLGGRLASGRQWMSWISREDAVAAFLHVLATPACRGPLNACSPGPVTNADFTRVLGFVLRRPVVFPVPAFALRLAFGQMAQETLLASTRAIPRGLAATGFRFGQPGLEAALRHELGRPRAGS
ncbi:MAG: TIGR01777 family oxidoreductase [Opitutaceae bacterium]